LPEWLRTRAKDGARKAPTAYDKEFVRGFGIKHGINLLKPENPDDVATAQALEIPNAVIKKTTDIYRYIFWRLTGESIEDYLRLRMGVNAKRWPVAKVAIVCGSESDLPAVQEAVRGILPQDAEIVVHVMSCHRNPKEVAAFAANGCGGAEAVIAVGGKALALPGIVDALVYAFGFDIPVIGVALGEPGSDALLAAQLSIEELPGAPVIIDEFVERAYEGADGLRDALDRIISGELPPSSMRTEKPVQMRVWSNNPTQ
jgi:5-(carboxyamino)imidazole ribonucleotide mutase